MAQDKVTVRIDDMTFVVVGGDGEDYVKSLAKNLNEKINETRDSNYRLNQVQSLVLTALNILDEREKLAKKNAKLVTVNKDEQEIIDSLKELDKIKKELEESEKLKDEYESVISKLNIKLKELEKEKNKFENLVSDKDKLIEDLRDDMRKVKEENINLEEQLYDSQKNIIDLNREIESITDDEE